MLEIKNLSFNVESNNEELGIINDVSLSFERGKLIVITGRNGGGKSTIAKIIMGIEKATSGQIILDGEDITNLSITERAKKGIGYAFPLQKESYQLHDLNSLLNTIQHL